MKINNDIIDPVEKTLARRFREQREVEALHAPAFPTGQELLIRASADAAISGAWLNAVPKFALAASVLLAVFLYLKPTVSQDPGELYADIMGANTVATDSLLSLSGTLAPQSLEVPGLFDFDSSFDDTFDARQ
ncbi:MAG: hypothetical protein AB8B81_06870 [Halioglobus sp.]